MSDAVEVDIRYSPWPMCVNYLSEVLSVVAVDFVS